MKLHEAKSKFIQTWGALGSNWGISKTMAQIHALLMISNEPLCTEDIMETLHVSRGNTNMNVRALIDWGLVYRELKTGDRREFFRAEKDIYKVGKQIVKIRREREVQPVINLLNSLQVVDEKTEESEQFKKQMKEFADFTEQSDALVGKLVEADQNWFGKVLMKLMK
jgi:DNA-binding transcriptional regulator GbsR (MarR family)